jgi:ribosomal protein S18 acetylase RimI-like enzyme
MIAIRPFADSDAPALAAMLREMAAGYGASIAADTQVEADLPGHARTVDILLACEAETLVGFATFASLFPVGGVVAFTYIQQIYVGAGARRRGIAQRLMAAVARAARDRGCRRLEWSTSVDNTVARALYDGIGAVGSAKLHYVLAGEALDRLAEA